MLTKQELRKEIKSMVRGLSNEEKETYSLKTCAMVMESPIWQQSKRIMVFLSMPDEISTAPLLADTSKMLFIPKVNGSSIDVHEYIPETLAPGAFGILEPSDKAPLLKDPSSLELVIVPGVAFTEDGLRLGRGKGFYDRFLTKVGCPLYGLCYPQQIVPAIPTDPWDLPLDGVFHV